MNCKYKWVLDEMEEKNMDILDMLKEYREYDRELYDIDSALLHSIRTDKDMIFNIENTFDIIVECMYQLDWLPEMFFKKNGGLIWLTHPIVEDDSPLREKEMIARSHIRIIKLLMRKGMFCSSEYDFMKHIKELQETVEPEEELLFYYGKSMMITKHCHAKYPRIEYHNKYVEIY